MSMRLALSDGPTDASQDAASAINDDETLGSVFRANICLSPEKPHQLEIKTGQFRRVRFQ